MIAYLKGQILQKKPGEVVVVTGGVGYVLLIPLSTYFKLGEAGTEVELLVHTHLTDDSLQLFGFLTLEEKSLFLKLITISGIGPKMAINILSGIEARELEEAVRETNVTRLSMIPGIGKKTALRVIMELADKIEKKAKVLSRQESREREDLVSALVNLGFRRKESEQVVDLTIGSLGARAGFDLLLRECLKRMSRI
ncbi:MAG: Holliday junction branch migration protein RuvA [Candidatus Saccharicenans sp.]|nr:Holliday junction branch migration protein RuvA [Candidatus Saccharicenans sp.]MDI6849208.1 Holliday junction branch migration protein RuvA [Candidatus Saccharicenans sp.]